MDPYTDPTRLANLLPLEYGERLETCISYFSSNWEELVDILDMPRESLLLLGRGWRVENVPPAIKNTNWRLRSPITVVIEPAWRSVDAAVRLASQLDAVAAQGASAEATILSKVDRKASSHVVKTQFKAEFLASETARSGCFLVEFALNTSFLNIFYVPPTDPGTRRYQSKISDVTLAHAIFDSPTGEQIGSATLHFDLGEECPPPPPMLSRDRAELIVDTLVSRTGLIELLNKPIKIGDGKVVPRGGTLAYPSETRTEHLNFTTRDDSYPRVVAEGLDATTDCCVCVVTQVEVQDTDYVLGDMYYKLYCPDPIPVPDPGI